MPRVPLPFVAVLLLALLVSACEGEEAPRTGETPAATKPAGPVSIRFWHSEAASSGETLDRLVARFNASQDAARVHVVYQGSYVEAMAKLFASFPSGDVPAVIFLHEGATQRMIDSEAITPIQDFIEREDYDLSGLDEKAAGFYTVDDTLWAMPFCVEMALLYYNKATFREVGLDPERPPQDLEELREYSEKILKRDASGVVRSGIAIDIKGWLGSVLTEHGDLYFDNANGHEGRATKVLFNNDTGRWFFQWWHDMVEEGLAVNVGRNPDFIEGLLAIAAGRAAMTFSYAGGLRSVVDALEQGLVEAEGIEIGVSQVPGIPGGEGLTGLAVYGLWVLKQRPEEEQEAAWKFIQWLMEPEQQAEWFAGSGYLPVSRASVDLPAAKDIVARYPLYQVPLDVYLSTPATPATLGGIIGPGEELAEIEARAVEEMLLAGKDPAQALEDAAAEANEAIEEYNRKVGD